MTIVPLEPDENPTPRNAIATILHRVDCGCDDYVAHVEDLASDFDETDVLYHAQADAVLAWLRAHPEVGDAS